MTGRRAFVLALLAACAPVRAAEDALSPAANAAFLAANAAKPGTVVRPSGLQYRVRRAGFGRKVGADDVVRLSYSVTLINGAVVEKTPQVLPMALGVNTLSMAGLAEALPLMREGDRWQVVIPANLGFGGKPAMNGAIPPNQTLIFDITLVSAAPPQPGQAVPDNPFSVWSNGREAGGAFTIRP
ncbi:MAG TPA: FKBP-type peptidyl-prolyl cis-trans isomerase [Rhizomicrobium sp.]